MSKYVLRKVTCTPENYIIAEITVEIKNPNNNFVDSCVIEGANLKVVEFVPSTTGTYKIIVTQTESNSVGGSGTATNIAVAWQ